MLANQLIAKYKINFSCIVLIYLFISFSFKSFSTPFLTINDTFPKREFRGVWVATVNNIDWPSKAGLSSKDQQKEFERLVNYCKNLGINAMIVQIRASADAFYYSKYEPWSHWLTGQQGKEPTTFYDPLNFMIETCHKNNIEFHAWINPFRSVQSSRIGLSENHIFNKKPEWHFQYNGMQILNPGLPEVRDYLCMIIEDIVRRYDVDAIHFDDYFYPYPVKQESISDIETFEKYNSKKLTLADWRRENINIFIKKVSATITQTKPEVKFGISPPGIWRNEYKDPEGTKTKGLSSFDDIFADSRLWIKHSWVDYIIPQIYWNISHKIADYKTITEWWGKNSFNTQIYIGHAAYKMNNENIKAWKDGREIDRQIANNRKYKNISGSAFFSISSLMDNAKSFADSIKSKYYKHPALLPAMTWKDSIPANAPIHFKKVKTDKGWLLSWKESPIAFDGDTAKGYLLYRFPDTCKFNTENTKYLISFIPFGQKNYHDIHASTKLYHYLLTAYDHFNNESNAAYQVFEDTTSIEVKNVVVALNKAQIDASAKVALQQGNNKVILKNIPKSLIKGSLVFKTSQNEEITLVKVIDAKPFQNNTDSASIYLKQKINEIKNQLSILNDTLEVYNQTEGVLLKNQQLASDKTNVDEIKNLENYFTTRLLELKKNIREILVKRDKLNEKAEYLKKQISTINTQEIDSLQQETYIAELDIISPSKQTSEIEISYQVSNVNWIPEYYLFYNKFNDQLRVQYKANIKQQSGQHWINIPVSVSSELTIDNQQQIDSISAPSIFKVAPQNVSILSTEQNQQVVLGEDKPNFESYLEINADTNHSPDIKLKIFNATEFEWFPGKMNIFLNNQLQQTIYFKPQILKDTLTLNLGKDLDVEILKTEKNNKNKNFLIFKKINHQYLISVKNNKNKNVNLLINSQPLERLIKKKSTKFFEKGIDKFDFAQQQFNWNIEVPAGKTIEIPFGYEYNRSIFKKH